MTFAQIKTLKSQTERMLEKNELHSSAMNGVAIRESQKLANIIRMRQLKK